jgi:SAM-dependent methyltransferase
MEREVGPSRATSEDIQDQLRDLTSREGPWTGHNVEVAPGVFTRGPEPSGDELRFRLVKQLAADLARRPTEGSRVLDLGALEGQYGLEFAIEGAEVVFVEGREPSAQKIRFALEALGVEGASVRTEDVRNLRPGEHGEFDVVLCIGVLYHLDQAGVFGLIRSMREVCRDLLILDTHVARSDGEIAYYGREGFWVDPRSLSAMREIELDGHRYRGRDYLEADRPEDLPDSPWSSIDNVSSFWPTLPSLINALRAAGFTTVLEPSGPWLGWPPDRRVLVAKVGEKVDLRSTSLDVGDYPSVPEWQPAEAGAPHSNRSDLRRLLGRSRR